MENDDTLAKEICSAIRKAEKKFHKELDEAFTSFSNNTFKVRHRYHARTKDQTRDTHSYCNGTSQTGATEEIANYSNEV